MGAIMPEDVAVYIGVAGTLPSALAAHSATFTATGYITNFSESGGEEDVESTPVFGGGNIDKIKPRSQVEVSFDIIGDYGTNALKFDEMKWGAVTGSEVKSSGDADYKEIALQWYDGTNYYTRVYNNVRAVTYEPESAADDMLKGTITFKLSPTTSAGVANIRIKAAALSTMGNFS